jgi:hypothetical protein
VRHTEIPRKAANFGDFAKKNNRFYGKTKDFATKITIL